MCRQLRWKLPPSLFPPNSVPTLPTRPLQQSVRRKRHETRPLAIQISAVFFPASATPFLRNKTFPPPRPQPQCMRKRKHYIIMWHARRHVCMLSLLSPLSHYIRLLQGAICRRRIECNERDTQELIKRVPYSLERADAHPVCGAVSHQLPMRRLFSGNDGKVSERGT